MCRFFLEICYSNVTVNHACANQSLKIRELYLMNVRAQVRLGTITLKLPYMVRISSIIIIYIHECIPQHVANI